jgi:hypothetical protein
MPVSLLRPLLPPIYGGGVAGVYRSECIIKCKIDDSTLSSGLQPEQLLPIEGNSRKHCTMAGAAVDNEGSIQQQCWVGAFDGGGVGQQRGGG